MKKEKNWIKFIVKQMEGDAIISYKCPWCTLIWPLNSGKFQSGDAKNIYKPHIKSSCEKKA